MNIEKSNEIIKFDIGKVLNNLSEQYDDWVKHVKHGDNMLYDILSGCLDFHNFLVREADYQSVFKGLCKFSWHKNTGLTTLVAKVVFGANNKQVYTYIKALDAALAQGIGTEGAVGMAHWLKENGGVSGVIGKDAGSSKAKIEREYCIRIAQNAEQFGLADKHGSFVSMGLANMIEHGSTDVVLLANVDRNTGEFKVKWLTEEVEIRDKLWEIRGAAIMTTPAYERHKDTYIEGIRQKNAVAADKICEALSKITSLKKIKQGNANIGKVCVEI